jgi:glycosyltransferase involved in cell wall biosynthesis
MSSSFDTDDLSGKPKILFIGLGESSHTHSWIDLLDGADFNVRLFALPSGSPPPHWPTKTYLTEYGHRNIDPSSRSYLFASGRFKRFASRSAAALLRQPWTPGPLVENWLAQIIRQWQPDIIHTLGMEAAGEFYFDVRRKYGLEGFGKWVLQTRGGSDLALRHLDPELRPRIAEVLRSCDVLVSDNEQNFRLAREMGVREDQLASIAPVPGTGGIDVDALAARRLKPPSQSRLILWPKAYECPWSKALPVFEALKLCWRQIQPCEIHILATTPETRQWYLTLPEEIRNSCRIERRIPRDRVLELITQARVMLAPSLVDGVPNSLYEAMAGGAFPIVSPLESIRPVVEQEKNVLFARNLYPDEIADALARAVTDDELVDAAAEQNLALVRRIANRSAIRARVVEFYKELAQKRKDAKKTL